MKIHPCIFALYRIEFMVYKYFYTTFFPFPTYHHIPTGKDAPI